jgi:hypothetical protein
MIVLLFQRAWQVIAGARESGGLAAQRFPFLTSINFSDWNRICERIFPTQQRIQLADISFQLVSYVYSFSLTATLICIRFIFMIRFNFLVFWLKFNVKLTLIIPIRTDTLAGCHVRMRMEMHAHTHTQTYSPKASDISAGFNSHFRSNKKNHISWHVRNIWESFRPKKRHIRFMLDN